MQPEQLTEPLAQLPRRCMFRRSLLEKLDLNRTGRRRPISAPFCPGFSGRRTRRRCGRFCSSTGSTLSAVAVGNLGHLPIAEGLGLPLWGDLGLNRFQQPSPCCFWQELGLEAAAVSMELRRQQLRDLRKVSALRGGGLRPPAADDHGKLRHPQ